VGLQAIADTRERGRGGSLEILLNVRPPAANKPIVLFHHIRKTAGTSMRHFFRVNLPKRGDHLYVDAPENLKTLTAWHQEFYASWSDDDRERVLYVAGHSANYLLPLFTRPVRAFTIVREPVDRTLSRYYFMKDRTWTIEEYVADADLRGAVRGLVNGQSLSLLEPHFDVSDVPDSADAEEAATWKDRLGEILDRYYTLADQRRFEASCAMIAHELGYKRVINPKLRVNSQRDKQPDLAPEVLARLEELNWLDRVLYDRAVAGIDSFFAEHPDVLPRKVTKGNPELMRVVDELRAQVETLAEDVRTLDARLAAVEGGRDAPSA